MYSLFIFLPPKSFLDVLFHDRMHSWVPHCFVTCWTASCFLLFHITDILADPDPLMSTMPSSDCHMVLLWFVAGWPFFLQVCPLGHLSSGFPTSLDTWSGYLYRMVALLCVTGLLPSDLWSHGLAPLGHAHLSQLLYPCKQWFSYSASSTLAGILPCYRTFPV